MAITKAARSKIFTLVQEIKKLLVLEVASQLQQFYGIRPDGSMLLVEQLPATEPEILHTARLLRQRIDYIKSNIPSEKNKEVEAIKQLLNEQAFSILNRFATLRMAEERGIIKETIRKEYNSEGFQIFDSITGQGAVAEQYIRYKWYLHSIFDELAIDLPSVFDRFSPYALIFPGERAMRSLLTIINNEAVTMHREEGKQPMNLWREDETIGWIYQYYNSREEISEMRDASDAPRNSRELAVRNQFFTPRYVVQFLTDNSLGRIWYEMTKGKTELVHKCQYLIRRPKELFLDKGNTRPENADEETDYIEYRQLKDPREILMLDPACGSMHFGLYSFDLFEQIYTEAWDNHPEQLLDLRNTVTRKQYIKQIPEFIIRYNIHGVDIDPRALQIAALSLWLRAQKSFEKLNLEPDERPQITKSNLVLAEAMPGNLELLSALVKPLDAPLRKLVTAIWELMKMAGETGLLLRIEEEIDRNINEIAADLSKDAKDSQLELGADERTMKAAERAALYSTKKYRDSFLENAASEVFRILKELSETATNGEAYQKLLFADDAARGFAFIELCRKKYDVVLMNPPFGAPTKAALNLLRNYYPNSSDNLYIDFIERTYELLNSGGIVGAITDRSFINKKNYESFRINFLIGFNSLITYIDLGEGVLDGANVDVAAHLYSKSKVNAGCDFLNLVGKKSKEENLRMACLENSFKRFKLDQFIGYPSASFVYDLPDSLAKTMKDGEPLSKSTFEVFSGLKSADAVYTNRLYWEVPDYKIGTNKKWAFFQNGSPFSPYYFGVYLVVACDYGNWSTVMSHKSARITHVDLYYKSGLSYGKRTDFMYSYLMRKGCVFSMEGQAIFNIDKSIWLSLLISNSNPYQEIANRLAGQHKPAGYVNPISLEVEKFPNYETQIKSICFNLELLDSGNEISTSFICPLSLSNRVIEKPFKESLSFAVDIRNSISTEANTFRVNYNIEVCNILKIGYNASSERNVDYVNLLYNQGNTLITECNILVSYFIGVFFERWDFDKVFSDYPTINEFDFFSEYKSVSAGRKIEMESNSNTVNVKVLESNKHTDSFNKFVTKLLNEKYKDKFIANDILSTICELLNCNSLDEYIQNNSFFNFHYTQYNRNRREAPIYWPISTSSGSYTVWLYYPKLTDQTLVSVINNYLQPKIDNVKNQIKPLEINSNLDNKGLKELAALKDFEHELEEMKKELLRITALPYKPNHDDGVLITAAPLHNLFRHAKWRKSTEDCWKALDKGEYDWAHLAYSIWPERVTKKCKKDLSMAMAHGLESICEIKPKEKKAKATKPAKKGSVNPQLNFEE